MHLAKKEKPVIEMHKFWFLQNLNISSFYAKTSHIIQQFVYSKFNDVQVHLVLFKN
jgi:hypothetical protein